MYTAEHLTELIDTRKFAEITRAYRSGDVAKNTDTLFAVALAYSMQGDYAAAEQIYQTLPPEKSHDIQRDIIFSMIRDRSTPVDDELLDQISSLIAEASSTDRKGVAIMALARAYRKKGCLSLAQLHIEIARLLLQESKNQTWQRNVAFWSLVLGVNFRHREALRLARKDPVPSRRIIATLCYIFPFIGKLPPLSRMY